jgi:hypothetical protein
MADYLTSDQVVAMLEAKRGDRTLEEFADEVGVSYQFLGHIFRRVRAPGREVLRYLGLRRIILYQKDRQRA